MATEFSLPHTQIANTSSPSVSESIQNIPWQTVAKYAIIGTTVVSAAYLMGRHIRRVKSLSKSAKPTPAIIRKGRDLPPPRLGPLKNTMEESQPVTWEPTTTVVASAVNGPVKVKELCIYPVKSCRGIMVDSFYCAEFGPQITTDTGEIVRDRSFMVTTKKYTFTTQRQKPKMSLIVPSISGSHMELNAPGMPPLRVPLYPDYKNCPTVNTVVQGGKINGVDLGDEYGEWFAEYLSLPGARFLYHPVEFGGRQLTTTHESNIEVWDEGDKCVFADDAPFLLLSQESVDEFNTRLPSPITWNHFRPNILVSGCVPYAEDQWTTFAIGEPEFRKTKLRARCVMTTVDPDTGTFARKDVLTTLKTYRVNQSPEWESLLVKDAIIAIDLAIDKTGPITVGDEIRPT